MQHIKNIDQEKKDYHEDIGFNLISTVTQTTQSLLQKVFALLVVI